jgi:hypothetical protein
MSHGTANTALFLVNVTPTALILDNITANFLYNRLATEMILFTEDTEMILFTDLVGSNVDWFPVLVWSEPLTHTQHPHTLLHWYQGPVLITYYTVVNSLLITSECFSTVL